jgi:PAS domain S-box-containing protein
MVQQKQFLRMNYTSRLALAAMTLLLPLVVFVVILVGDRNTQIRETEMEISGVYYLLDLRRLLELVPQHSALHQQATLQPANHGHSGHGGEATQISIIADTVADINRTVGKLVERAETDGNPFQVLETLQTLRNSWKTVNHDDHHSIVSTVLTTDEAVQRDLVVLIRQVGNTSTLVHDGFLRTSLLANLIVHELPQMVERLSLARSRAVDIVQRGDAVTAFERIQLSIDDWALTDTHDSLFYGYNAAVSEDAQIAENLARHFEAFDRDTLSFHKLVASGDLTAQSETVLQLGTSSITATLRLFDEIVPELRRILEIRVSRLENTRLFAILSVVAASLIAAVFGFLLLRSITQPLQAEIVERRRAEIRLGELADIVEQSEDAIFTLSLKGKFRSWNGGAERLYGYSAEEVLGKKARLLAPHGYEDETISLLRRAIGGEQLPPHETVRVHKKGDLIDVAMRLTAVLDADGAPRGVALIVRDISERKRAEAELINKEQTLQYRVTELHKAQTELKDHRDRLEDLVHERTAEVAEKAAELEVALRNEKEFNALQRKFISVASHEFRTPLAIIDGAAQRIMRRIDNIEPEDLETRISRIRGAVARMLGLIDSTLSASRLDEGQVQMNPRPLDIADLISTVCERHAELSDKLDIELDLKRLPSSIDGDEAMLDQVITNLMSNAIKYSPEQPRIKLTGEMLSADQISIAVTDNGVGIPDDELSRLFDRFFRATTSEGIPGTGIGLNLVHELVGMHDGDIEVTSTVGQGTTFTIHLPVRARAAESPTPIGQETIAAA